MRLAERRVPTPLEMLLDEGSFEPVRTRVLPAATTRPHPGDGVLCGSGRVAGRRVFCYEQDPSVLGGSLGAVHADSICRVLDLAERFGRPVLGVHASGGARIQEGVGALAGYARIFARHVRLREHVPQIGLVVGPCAGGAAYGPALMDAVVMPRADAYMFLTGPDVVRSVTGEDVGFADLGGAAVQSRSGLATLVGDDTESAAALARLLLSYLPDRIGDPAPRAPWSAPAGDPAATVPADPRRPYDVRDVVRAVVDRSSWLELKATFAPNLVTGLARIEGGPVGVVANQPCALAGTIDAFASEKGAWFVRTCDRFGLPVVVLVDTPGFLPGRGQELAGVISRGAAFLSAFASARVPKATVVLRKAYGGAYIVMNARDLGADYAFAWPGAEIAVMGARGAVGVLHRRTLAGAPDPEAARAELEDVYRREQCTPWPAAHGGHVDEVIEPGATRARLASWLDDAGE